MTWRKLGLLFRPDGTKPWMQSHATNPFTLTLDENTRRVFFSSRDAQGRNHVGWCDVDVSDTPKVIRVADEPVLAPGPLGYFDDHGVYGSSVVEKDDRLFLYYAGWNPGKRAPMFYASIGLAISDDGGRTFRKYSSAPLLGRSDIDPWMTSACCVQLENGVFRMWYISGIGWHERADGELWSRYHIKYAESPDGVRWKREGHVAIGLREGETNIARPTIMREDGVYKAWFPVHSGASGYRMGYAESPDGLVWTRDDAQAGIAPSADGFDSESVSYPWVFKARARTWLLYNGNGFGREGIGLAVRAGDEQ